MRVPTTLNVGSMDLIHPELFRGPPALAAAGRELMEAHEALGCVPTFTCAPYQTLFRPAFGEQIAWAESNAIVFANSVIGARTAPLRRLPRPRGGAHRPRSLRRPPRPGEPARPRRVRARPGRCRRLGRARRSPSPSARSSAAACGERVPGHRRPAAAASTEDDLKALGAVAASTGSVALFHAVGLTPEAPTSPPPSAGGAPAERDPARAGRPARHDLGRALATLSTVGEGAPLAAVASARRISRSPEFERLLPLLEGSSRPRASISTSTPPGTPRRARPPRLGRAAGGGRLHARDRHLHLRHRGDARRPGSRDDQFRQVGPLRPGNLGVDVAFGTLADCLASAAPAGWSGGRRGPDGPDPHRRRAPAARSPRSSP